MMMYLNRLFEVFSVLNQFEDFDEHIVFVDQVEIDHQVVFSID